MTKLKLQPNFLHRFGWLAVILLLLCACTQSTNEAQKPTRSLKQIQESGKLIVLTRNAPTSLYIDRDGQQSGPEYDLIESFAASLDLDVEYKIMASIKEIIDGIENAQGDLAAAGLNYRPPGRRAHRGRRYRRRPGPGYRVGA